ncbi:MAG TPA: imidazole glycerol phosphate synthase subunit HisH [Bryobacteraceae bacterium]|nr:imidazole glycerol phosphate synthase subunit HisH [Bryobacteraceae bacterium]
MITILDYGAGNLRSVQNTLAEIGAEYELVRDSEGLQHATKIILPGVGHFGQMMRALDQMRVREALMERIRASVPFLGICLGLQALFQGSEEAPEERGLGLFEGTNRRFPAEAKVPHMGWNEIKPRAGSKLLAGLAPRPYLYFAHSYYAPINSATAAVCSYTADYTAVLECGNMYGVQFHPEKSGPLGLKIVRNFVGL